MVKQIDDLLRKLGWADGFHIPVASDENKALEKQVEQCIKKKGELTIQYKDLTDRVNSLMRYAENVKLEQQQNQAILIAHKRQVETEENLYQLARAEQDSYERELRLISKAFHELGERRVALQNGIITHTEKLEKLKANVEWDKDVLRCWEEDIARDDEHSQLLARYMTEDESKVKELELTRLQLCQEVEERNQLLNQIIGDEQSLQQVLDQTAKMFRQAHSERQELISQWEGSVQVLHQRDLDIHNKVQEISMLHSESQQKVEMQKEQRQFFRNEVNNNKETEADISVITRSTMKLQNDYKKLLTNVDDLANELGTMRRTLAGCASHLEHQRHRNTVLASDNVAKEKHVKELVDVVQRTKERLEQVTNRTVSASERTQHLEDMIKSEENKIDILVQQRNKFNDLLCQIQQELCDLKKQEEQQHIDIRGLESAKVQVLSNIQQTKKDFLCQTETVFNKEFEAQMIESRILRLTGTGQDAEEKEAIEKKIAELEEVLSEKVAALNLLTAQNQRLENRVRRLTKALKEDSAELENLAGKRQDQILLTDGGQKQLKLDQAHNQAKQVEENVLRLRVVQAEKAIAHEGDKVYSLEKQKLELDTAMKERKVEIGMHKDILFVQKRKLNEDRCYLIADIKACETKICQLQKKYDIVMSSLGQSESGEQLSVTYFKIKSAQEKYELQQQGDKLDEKIRTTEKEIQAMENTLKVINLANDKYKKNLSAVDEESDEYKKKQELESQYYVVLDTLKHQKTKLSELDNQTKVLDQTLQEIFITHGNKYFMWQNKDQEASDLDKDLREQTIKLERAQKQLHKTMREIKGTRQSQPIPFYLKDVMTRELQEQNQSALQQLAEFVAHHIEAGPVVTRYLEEKGLVLPLSRSPGGSLTRVLSRHTPSSTRLSLPGPGAETGASSVKHKSVKK
ncbi:coiled-coil domain-containing protein 39-like isoform X2 [Zootermopsis nevadensis]|uniref:coiled-coil domain-containing protein 39-like isoform X2 n=1 Tax=Zootermopsis nevadensis TaxID=136037 RepID=UPI000B8E4B7E|nr:coiled-coil domain-containing protein 39-like isoform X2 [Zootermopsis nevadensis]